MLRETVLVFAALAVLARATVVNQCGTENPLEGVTQVMVSSCDKPTCPLKQGTTVTIEIKFVPNKNIQNLINDVSAIILNAPLPFIGVDGTNACDNMYNPDGTKVGCPLRKGVEYLYRNSFGILPIYPRIAVVVRYALREGNDQIVCFELPSKITK